ncbi:MAG: aminoacyl-tRNA hydrolase [Candidatus Zapsychrus exili]|nr:aminoacyl-tRNA hydrolase [Candidatus Zapsychrus exili]
MSEFRLIVGLGNPGKDYEYTRHNLGFLVVQNLAKKINAEFKLSSLTKGFETEAEIDGVAVDFLLPLTYMNNSGSAVKKVIEKRDIALKNVLIVCDDFNLDFEQIRLRTKGSDGGHNGLSSVIYLLETDEFSRLRLGIGSPNGKKDTADYVLEEFNKKEKETLEIFIEEATECCLVWLKEGSEKAMELYNRRKGNG